MTAAKSLHPSLRLWLASVLALGGATLALSGTASASQAIGTNATDVKLVADGSGRALVTFTSGGSTHRLLASGAVDARPPTRSSPQVEFKIDNRGGTVHNSCTPVKLPLAWFVAGCRAADGSYWALQSWQRLLPNGGAEPSPAQAARELRLSHWTDASSAALAVRLGWSYQRVPQLYGLYSYGGDPVFGYRVRSGVPLDGYGRNIYVDAFSSDIGKGWKPRQQLPRTRAVRGLLLRVRAARRAYRRRQAAACDGDRARRHAGRDVGGAGARRVRPRGRRGRGQGPDDAPPRRQVLPTELSSPYGGER